MRHLGICQSTHRPTRCQVWTRFWIVDRSRRNNISLWNPIWSKQVTPHHSTLSLINSLVRFALCSHFFPHQKPSENLKGYQGFVINTGMLIRLQVRRLFGPQHSSTQPLSGLILLKEKKKKKKRSNWPIQTEMISFSPMTRSIGNHPFGIFRTLTFC